MLLRVVAQSQPVPGQNLTGVGLLRSAEQLEQGGLAGAVQPEHHHPAPPVDGQVDPGEDLQRTVGLGQIGRGERGAPARGRLREADLRDPVGHPDVVQPGDQLLRATHHLVGCRGLGGLGSELGRLGHQHGRLLLGVGPLPPAALLIGGPGLQVPLPGHVVDVELTADRVQEPDLVHHRGQQVHIVRDDHHAAVEVLEVVTQPDDRVGIQMVGRLVQQQHHPGRRTVLGAGAEQDPGQFHPSPLATGERVHGLGQDPVRQSEVGTDPGSLGFGGVPAEAGELLLDPPVALGGRFQFPGVGELGHLDLDLLQLRDQHVQAAGGEHPVLGGDVHVALAGVLREIADRQRPGDRCRRAAVLHRPAPAAWSSSRRRSGRPGRPGRRGAGAGRCRPAGSSSRPGVPDR